MRITRALLSVADKTGLDAFARGLAALGIELVSTGGTAEALKQSGCTVTTVETLTGFPELAGGRVKTLHPAVHGAILARRDDAAHMAELSAHRIAPIDLVVVNLYPFESTVAKAGVSDAEAIEQIDIGGVALLRAAAKNHRWVGVVCDAVQYEAVLRELQQYHGELTDATRRRLARDAFARTARYDQAIHAYLNGADAPATPDAAAALPPELTLRLERVSNLRYGENPHQQAAWYRLAGTAPQGLATAKQLWGKELSYNNVLDAGTALATVWEFAESTACVVKHLSPCGVASHARVDEAFRLALACDPLSAFGGIVGLNCALDEAAARALLTADFLEVIVAPRIEPAAAQLLHAKKNLRIIEVPNLPPPGQGLRGGSLDVRGITGGVLVQTPDERPLDESSLRVASQRAPTAEERHALTFAWRAAKHVRSNAIVLARSTHSVRSGPVLSEAEGLATGSHTVGIGGGLPSRIDAVLEAIRKAGERARGAVLASDAFFPKDDNITAAAQAGITAIIQPGGSRRDEEVIAAADQAGLAMLFAGIRHFKH